MRTSDINVLPSQRKPICDAVGLFHVEWVKASGLVVLLGLPAAPFEPEAQPPGRPTR